MAAKVELLKASDQEIADAVFHADKMVLRGVLYHLTGDESVVAMKTAPLARGFITVKAVTDPADIKLLEAKAVEFLKAYRDRGAGELPPAPPERLQRSLSLAAGEDIADRDMGMWVEELALHPFARGLEWSERPDPKKLDDFKVLVIGGGMNGLNTAAQLKHAGIPFVVVEKNAEVGGTWYENVYPGARVDTPSRAYTLICGANFDHPYAFSPQSENFKYTRWLAEKHDIRQHFEFETEVKSLTWDEDAKLWEVRAEGRNGPRTWRVNAVISAVGFLSRPSVPTLEGAEEFKGEIFHTARWPKGIDIKAKRVAVVGSGCSGYQVFPEIARVAAHTFLFQRTPSWVFEIESYLNPLPPQVNWLERNLPYYRNFLRFRGKWLHGPNILGHIYNGDPGINDPIREQRIKFIQGKFAGRPELFDKMLPKYPPNASRPVLVDDKFSVYDVLLQDNTTLVTEGIARLTKHGIIDNKGQERAVDVIVLATGFRTNEFLWPMEVRGREGKRAEQLWEKDGPRAYLGTMLPGFPNFFMVYGPNTNPVGGAGVPAIHEMETRFIVSCLAHLILNDKSTVEVVHDAYERYNDEVDKAEKTKIYARAGVKNYYTNEYGRSSGNCPFDGRKMWEWFRDPTGRYAESTPGESINVGSHVRPYFGQDLIVE
jgi:4-hydroxyacetophenone monooxygenase